MKVYKLTWDVFYSGPISGRYNIKLSKGDLLFFEENPISDDNLDPRPMGYKTLTIIKKGDIMFCGLHDLLPGFRDMGGYSVYVDECAIDITLSWNREERLKEIGI